MNYLRIAERTGALQQAMGDSFIMPTRPVYDITITERIR